jgi:hypothetical protein
MVNFKEIIQQQSADEKLRLEQIEADSIPRKEWMEGWPIKIKEITETLISEMTDSEFIRFGSGIKEGYIFYTIRYDYRPGLDYSNDSIGHKWMSSIIEYDKSLLPKLTYPLAGNNTIFSQDVYDEIVEDINKELDGVFQGALGTQFTVDLFNFKDEEENEQYSASLIMMFKLDL